MPGCAAVGCRNSDRKGFSMRRFPSDPKRRTEWLLEMKRGKWTPTEFSRLCEAHFAPEMWEQHRIDGKKRLKMNAVPRLFAFTKFEEYWKPPAEIFSERKPTSLGMDIHNDPTSGGSCMSAPGAAESSN
ncbi:hypothetical protein NQ317_012816 [Molorchus minor]|uniref:THAP-type domain-containing protein n=1 Tax=Molorchus minor TaxID=1323400 RepID=A0ABQ9K5M1_9CUCU|nr:hypothetical protein NQ317_012816 [Molorchus minor]